MYFNFTFFPSAVTSRRLANHEIEQMLSWQVTSVEADEIGFLIETSHEDYIDRDEDKIVMDFTHLFTRFSTQMCTSSYSSYENCANLDSLLPEIDLPTTKDQLGVRKLDGDDQHMFNRTQAFSLQISFKPYPYEEVMMETITAGITAAVSVASMNILSTIFLSQVIQFLWGAINSLQLIVLTVLFTQLMMPERCKNYLHKIMQYTNLDIIEVDDYLEAIFGGFPSTEPFSESFEMLGYQTSNFFLEMGPLMFLIMLFLVWAPFRKLIQIVSMLCSDNFLTRRMKQATHFKMTVVRFLLEGSIEISLSAYICILKMNKNNFDSFWFGVSTGLAIATILVQFILPFYLIRAKNNYLRETMEGVVDSRYREYFADLLPKNKPGLFYSTIFFMRRLILVTLIMVFMRYEQGQAFTHIVLSVLQLTFVLATKPFDS